MELLTVIPRPDHGSGDISPEVCWNNHRWSAINDGERKGLVALVQIKLEEEGVEEAIALPLSSSRCLKFDNRRWNQNREVCSTSLRCVGSAGGRAEESREEVKASMEEDGVAVPVPSDPKWLMDLALQEEFEHRFADFKTPRARFQIFADLFSFDVQDAPPVLQMELVDLQCNSEPKAQFRELFSTLNFNKSKYRSRLTDEHLQALLRVSPASSLKPNVARPCERKRCQVASSKNLAQPPPASPSLPQPRPPSPSLAQPQPPAAPR
ncbi:hypothetical protein D4764_03G0002380 [Takifugu flavidus]|uniref:Uncharacterized protein n=1 Tax=Takifugu flavidus TaxID=433684 RepID=A0A5C6NBH3_9TELE|nr:hypothetical protein D4764_03G0002380 [Takifugu flavidus]